MRRMKLQRGCDMEARRKRLEGAGRRRVVMTCRGTTWWISTVDGDARLAVFDWVVKKVGRYVDGPWRWTDRMANLGWAFFGGVWTGLPSACVCARASRYLG